MSGEMLASKNIILEEEPQLRSIPAQATAVGGFVGCAKMGPVGEEVQITSWDEFVRYFGGYTDDGELPMAVRGAYRQDPGAVLHVVRTVHYSPDATDPTHKTSVPAEVMIQGTAATPSAGKVTSANLGPFNLEPGQTLVIHVDADVGGPDTATFSATKATKAGSGFAVVNINTETLILKIDGGETQTITFGAETTAAQVAATINANLLGGSAVVNGAEVDIKSDKRGTGSSVQITGGSALAEIGHSVGTATGTGNVADINAVTFSEAKSIIEAAVTHPVTGVTVTEEVTGEITITSDTTGVSSSIQVEVASTALGFGFDNTLHTGSASSLVNTLNVLGRYDGTYAEELRAVIASATDGEAAHFNLRVTDENGTVLETFPNLQITDDAATDYVETVINKEVAKGGSKYFIVEDQLVDVRPNNGTYTPAGGNDGLTSINDNDFLGDSAGATGLHAFDLVQDLRLVAIPGRATSAVHNGLITYCEADRDGSCFAILDPPAGLTAAEMVTYVKTTAAIYEASEYAAIYWPRIKVLNPNTEAYGQDENITVPPSGWVFGVYSRTDRSQPGGIYQPPAGIERGRIFGCLGFETDEVLDERKRDLVFPANINPISRENGTPRFIDGPKVLKTSGNFPSVAERRGVINIEQSIKNGTIFARHSNNDEDLRARLYRTIVQYLRTQMKLGAFRTKDPATAFFVDLSDALNTPDVVFQNKVVGRIGLATQKPAYWVVFSFSQDTRALLESLGE